MDSGYGLFKFLFPQIPSLATTALSHSLGRSPTSSKWDLRTELTIHVLRKLLSGGGTVSQAQKSTLKDPGVKGKTWVATETIRAPEASEEDISAAVYDAIEALKPNGADELRYSRPTFADTEVEWTGFRPNAGKDDKLPNISEAEKYKRLMAEPTRTSETTVLYFHGGAYYLCDPATHRALCSRIAKETHGRVCNVRYRLAPQTAFPGQLMDAFLVYVSLLYPPPGSMHEPVSAENIVFTGDSAGGNLTFALLQLLLHLHRTAPTGETPTVLFHNSRVEVPLPAGAAANSGWFDISRSFPSISKNAAYDYLPPPRPGDPISHVPQDAIWPANPPRGDIFCDLTLLDHPLVSPVAAESWENSPPMWQSTGQECLHDEDALLASRAAAQEVKVQYEEYEAMPHCFALVLPWLPTAERCLKSMCGFITRCVEDPGAVEASGIFVYAKSGKEVPIDLSAVSKLSFEEARGMMKETKDERRRLRKEGQSVGSKALL